MDSATIKDLVTAKLLSGATQSYRSNDTQSVVLTTFLMGKIFMDRVVGKSRFARLLLLVARYSEKI